MTGLEIFLLIFAVCELGVICYLIYKIIKIINKSYLYYTENIKLTELTKEMIILCAKISKNDGWMKNPDLNKLVTLAKEIEKLNVSKIKADGEKSIELLFQ